MKKEVLIFVTKPNICTEILIMGLLSIHRENVCIVDVIDYVQAMYGLTEQDMLRENFRKIVYDRYNQMLTNRESRYCYEFLKHKTIIHPHAAKHLITGVTQELEIIELKKVFPEAIVIQAVPVLPYAQLAISSARRNSILDSVDITLDYNIRDSAVELANRLNDKIVTWGQMVYD